MESRTAELQRANEALRGSQADLQHAKEAAEAANYANGVVLDTALDAVVTIDSHGMVTTWNLQAETMFGWDRKEVIGRRLDQIIIPDRYSLRIEDIVVCEEGGGRKLNSYPTALVAND